MFTLAARGAYCQERTLFMRAARRSPHGADVQPAAEAALSRQGAAGEFPENLPPRYQGLLHAPVVLADRGPPLLLVLRPDKAAGELRLGGSDARSAGEVSREGPGRRFPGTAPE